MKRSMRQLSRPKHHTSEYLRVSLMAVVLLFAAIIINLSNLLINKLLPFILLKNFRKTISNNHDINTNTL